MHARPSRLCSSGIAVLVLAALPGMAAAQVSIGQQDTFQGGTTEGWFAGIMPIHPAPPVHVASGGPGGDGDGYLLIRALGGNAQGSRLAAMNASQWAGDYLAAGIAGIRMDVRNFSGTDLFLRLVLEDPMMGPPTNLAFSLSAFFLPAMSGWVEAFFPITEGALVPALGTYAAALGNTTVLRIYHSPELNAPNPFNPIPSVVAELGVDNITALGPTTVVPEPFSVLLLGTGLAGVAAARRRRNGSAADCA